MRYARRPAFARVALMAASVVLAGPLALTALAEEAVKQKGQDAVQSAGESASPGKATSKAGTKTGAGDPKRIEVIMGGLPPKDSAAYKAIIKYAGDAKGQFLPLTKCEMWAIRPQLLDRLRKEAAKHNVQVKVLDNDFNRVLDPMSTSDAADSKVTSMVDQAMQSKSTMSVGLMSTRHASMVEYALTRDPDSKNSADHPMSVRIALNDKASITAVRRSVEIKGQRCVWRGVVEGTENPVTIMWWGSGRLTGTIQHSDRMYQLKQLTEGTIGVVETMVDKMPDEHPRTSSEMMQKMKMREDNAFMKGDASDGRARPRPTREGSQDSKDDPVTQAQTAAQGTKMAGFAPKSATPAEKPGRKMKTAQKGKAVAAANPDIVIDVMVAYTGKAASHYSDIKRDLVELAVEEAEESFRASGVPNLKLRLVHTHQTDYDEGTAEHFDHVWRMVDKGDGFMEEIPVLRDKYKADVVLLVVDDARGCGLATRVAAEAEEAYAVVHHECAATTYSLAHELGHIIGARHDRLIDKTSAPFPFGHGFVDPGMQWRTMMSYKAGCNGCPRKLIWSSPTIKVGNGMAGDEMHDNARVLRENAERVSRFR